jgi:hypothetical protein
MLTHPPVGSYGVGTAVRYAGPPTLVLSLDGGLVALGHGMVGTVTAADGGRVVVQFRNSYRAALRGGSVDFEEC